MSVQLVHQPQRCCHDDHAGQPYESSRGSEYGESSEYKARKLYIYEDVLIYHNGSADSPHKAYDEHQQECVYLNAVCFAVFTDILQSPAISAFKAAQCDYYTEETAYQHTKTEVAVALALISCGI